MPVHFDCNEKANAYFDTSDTNISVILIGGEIVSLILPPLLLIQYHYHH